MRKLHLFSSIKIIYFLFLGTSLFAQNNFTLNGIIQDTMGNPIPGVLIFSKNINSNQFLASSYSNEGGNFSIPISSSANEVSLYFKLLGFEDKNFILPTSDTTLTVVLKESSYQLEEIRVKEDKNAFVIHGDTTSIDLSNFRDSNERNVEELLGKIPGVQVDANGTISVNGRNIRTILIEDSDMFGQSYTMASKNIKANYIDQVQIIERYEPNPALKNVNLSEDIVLNLRIKEEFKNILAGNIELGLGYGDELKGLFRSNLFLISRKTKLIWLSDNSNNEINYSPENLQYMLGSVGSYDIRKEIIDPHQYQYLESITNPGIRSTFVDNGLKSFNTLRSDKKLGKNWTLKGNATLGWNKFYQENSFISTLISNPESYNLRQNNEVNHRSTDLQTDISLNYIAPQGKTVLENFFSYTKKDGISEVDRLQQFNGEIEGQFSDKSNSFDNVFIGSMLTQILDNKNILQFYGKGQWHASSQNFNANNDVFPNYFNLSEDLNIVNQDIDYNNKAAEFSAKWNHVLNRGIIQFESTLLNNSLNLTYLRFFSNEEESDFSDNTLNNYSINALELRNKLNVSINLPGNFKLLPSVNYDIRQVVINEIQTDFRLFNGRVKILHTYGANNTSYLQYNRSERAPSLYNSIPFQYMQSVTAINNQILQMLPITSDNLSFYSNYNKPLSSIKLDFYANYSFNQKLWNNSIDFINVLEQITPFYGEGNTTLMVRGGFSCFIKRLLMTFSSRPYYSLSSNKIILQEQNTSMTSQTLGLLSKIDSRIKKINVSVQVNTSRTINDLDFTQEINQLTNINGVFGLGYKLDDYHIELKYQTNKVFSDNLPTANLNGAWLQIRKTYDIQNSQMEFSLLINNLFNNRTLEVNSFNDYFISTTSTRAIAPFFILSASYQI